MIINYFKNEIPIYTLTFYSCFDPESFNKLLRRNGFNELSIEMFNDCEGFVYHDEKGFLAVYLKDGNDFNTVSHESFHLVDRIGELIGFEYSKDTGNEQHAYLL